MKINYWTRPTKKVVKIANDLMQLTQEKGYDADIYVTCVGRTHSYGTVWEIGNKTKEGADLVVNYYSSAGIPAKLRYSVIWGDQTDETTDDYCTIKRFIKNNLKSRKEAVENATVSA